MSAGRASVAAPEMRSKGAPLGTQEALRAYIPYLVNRLSNRLGIDQNRLLADHGLNNAALRTLSVLHIYATLTINDISVLAVIEQSTASRTIDTLHAAGLVTRVLGEADQRRRVVGLTREGEALLRRVWPVVEQNYERMTDGIAQEEIRLCANVLSRMIDNVRKHPL